MNELYEVLSPWAEVDQIPLKGISPRLTNLANAKIGLFSNLKQPARPMLTVVERKLKEKFPVSEISWYKAKKFNVPEIQSANKAKFEEWLKGVDAVVLAVGD
jgi:hypothetical protein